MALVALGGMPLVRVGAPTHSGLVNLNQGTGTVVLIDAANEACIMIGQIFTEDGASHTIDTTGSSSLGWRTTAVTFANAGTAVKVGLAAVDLTAGPPGRAVNVANVITFDVSKTLTGGGGGITANAWQEHAPDAGTKTIANGDFVAFAVQMITTAGGDAVNANFNNSPDTQITLPCVTGYIGGAYSGSTVGLPNAVVTFSDGTYGFFVGGVVFATASTIQTWNSGSATKEYGNFFQAPFPMSVYGICFSAAVSGDADFILYSDPLGTPAAAKTASVDLNIVNNAVASRVGDVLFASPYNAAANQPLAAIMKPTSGTNVAMTYKTFNVAGHQKSEHFGPNGYAVNRASGAFAAQNSNKDRFSIGLLVGGGDDGTTVGGYPASRVLLGM